MRRAAGRHFTLILHGAPLQSGVFCRYYVRSNSKMQRVGAVCQKILTQSAPLPRFAGAALRILPTREGEYRMNEEHPVIQEVYAAKGSMQEADLLIQKYLPFIKKETAKFLQRPPIEGQDDELSIAMLAFHEAVQHYTSSRGAFLPYAALTIKNRLIDYRRREQRHHQAVSLDAPANGSDAPLSSTLAGGGDHGEELVLREATREEIEELSRQMAKFGVTLTDVAENCPRQQRTLEACRKVLRCAKETPGLLDELLHSGRLPVARLTAGSGVERKTIERHRKYLVALLLIYTNGYELIRDHIKRVLKGGAGR